MGIDEGPADAGCALSCMMSLSRSAATLPSRALASLREKSGSTFMPAWPSGHDDLAVLQQRHRRIAGEDHAIGFRPGHVQDVVHRPVDRLQAIVEHVELRGRLGEAVHLAEPAAEPAQHRACRPAPHWRPAWQSRCRCRRSTASSRSILRALLGIALPQHQAALQLGDLLVHVIGLGQIVRRAPRWPPHCASATAEICDSAGGLGTHSWPL